MFKNLIFLGLILLFGCATPTQYVPGIDFVNNGCPTDKACVYVIRPASFVGSALHFAVSENNKSIGITGPGSYLAWQTDPGRKHLESRAENIDTLNFTAVAGQSYYVLQSVEPGIISGRNEIHMIPKDEAEGYIARCHPVNNKQ